VVTAGEGGTEIAQNWLDMRAERALSNFDQRHQVTAQMQYTFGMGVRGGPLIDGWKGALLKDWGLQWEMKAGSGFPQTPIYYVPLKGIGVIGNLRPDYTGASIQSAPPGLFLNPAAFCMPATNQWGNAGRNSITGPSQFTMSVGMSRMFSAGGRARITLSINANNALNHVTFTSWNTTIGSAQFGLPTAPKSMRSVQTSLRLNY